MVQYQLRMQSTALSKVYVAIKRQCPLKSSNRFIRLFELNKHFGLAQPGVCEIAIERKRTIIRRKRTLMMTEDTEHKAADKPSLGEVRVQRHGSIVSSERIAESLQFHKDVPTA